MSPYKYTKKNKKNIFLIYMNLKTKVSKRL